jgi:hypothetical protein
MKTVVYNVGVLKGLYGDIQWEQGMGDQMGEYLAARKAGREEAMEKYKNPVRRSWNILLEAGTRGVDANLRDVVLTELQELDSIFNTHYETGTKYFMTSASEWTDVWGMYVEGLERHVDSIAQRPWTNSAAQQVVEHMKSKLRWVLMDHEELHIAPPFPVMTRSVVPLLARSLKEISTALTEVSDFKTM